MRYHYLDNLRAILMMLGVVLHTCAAFSVTKYWVLSYPEALQWTDYVNDAIFYFRMPGFFMISGFFAILLLDKWSPTKFIANKLMRIGIPLIAGLILINLPQLYFLEYLNESLNIAVNLPPIAVHLWFLINLLIYFFMIVLLHPLLKFIANKLHAINPFYLIVLAILAMPFFQLFVLSLNGVGIPIYSSIPIAGSLYSVFLQFDYFLIGTCLYLFLGNKLTNTIRHKKWMLLATLLIAMNWVVNTSLNINTQSTLGNALDVILTRWQVVGICMLLLTLASILFDNTNIVIQKLFNASYSVYLVHHLIIIILVALASEFLFGRINSNVVFVLILSTALLLSYCFHDFLVSKSKALTLLFNGK